MGEWKLTKPTSVINLPGDLIRLSQPIFGGSAQGKFVAVRSVKEEKTKLGLYLGDLPMGFAGSQSKDTGDVTVIFGRGNPAIFVFSENQIVYGCESWWGEIRSPEQLREITDGDIENVWYVQALKQLDTAKADEGEGA